MGAWCRLVAAAAVVVGLVGCTPESPRGTSVNEVRIGLLAPLSGPNTPVGRDAKRGAELAAALVNDDVSSTSLPLGPGRGLPGLGGATLKIVDGDTADDLTRGERQAVRLAASQGVSGVVGAGDTQVMAVASERTERLHVPFVSGDASASYLTERGMDWFFRTGPTDRMLGATLLSLLAQANDGPTRRLGVVHTADEVGNDIAAVFGTLADEADTTITATAALPPGQSDPQDAISQVRTSRPEALIAAAAQPADAKVLLEGFRAAGYQPAALAGMGVGFTPQVVQATGGAGMLRVAGWSAELAARNPTANAVMALYQRQYQAAMSEPAADAFTAVLTLAQAIDAAHSTEPEQVRAALLGLDVRARDTIMPWSGIQFDQAGQNTQADGVVEQLRQHRLQVVFPHEFAAPTT